MGVLELLGISGFEERVYTALLDEPHSTVSALMARVAVARPQLARALEGLEVKGLVARSAEHPTRYAPTPPGAALEVLVLRRREQLESARLQAAEFETRLRLALERRGQAAELVEVVAGPTAVAQRVGQIRAGARKDILEFSKPPFVEGADEAAGRVTSSLRSGVAVRCIYDPTALESSDTISNIRECMSAGEQSRSGEVPIKLSIADRQVAIMPVETAGGTVEKAMVIRADPVVRALVAFFELIWERAVPLQLGGPERRERSTSAGSLERADLEILSLLAAGHKDESISRALAIGDRTVGRRIERLMTMTGCRTRFQLGQRAAQRGWIR